MSSNLPPGVTEYMITGNTPDDIKWEKFWNSIDKDAFEKGFTPEEAAEVWEMGKAAWKSKKAEEDWLEADWHVKEEEAE